MKILIAVDGSEASLDAVRHTLNLNRNGLKADFLLGTVQEPTYTYELMLAPNAQVLERLTGAVGERCLQSGLALFAAAGVLVQHEIGSGEVAPTLLAMAASHGCEAIVMGARGVGMVSRVLLGSVSSAVLQHSTIPVKIV